MKGLILPVEKDLNQALINFLKKGLDKGSFEAILVPKRVPSGDSFAYLLIKDPSIVEGVSFLPPVISVQGARAISSLTREGKIKKKILAIMRPCEIRATIELFKLQQAELENIFFLSMDCPGAIPLSQYVQDPEKNDAIFWEAVQKEDSEPMRPMCKICQEFSLTTGDLHIGLLGTKKGNIFLIPNSPKGEEILESLELKAENPVESWENKVKELKKERKNRRTKFHKELKSQVEGTDKLLESFSPCINCHNCMRVCPVCYCRQCYFESEAFKLPPENFIARAEKKGSLRLPPDTLLFHLGRMSHMIQSCVSCGTCEDACPMEIPVAQIFSLVSDKYQELFDYVPGRDMKEPLPSTVYNEEELQEVERPYTEIYVKGEKTNV